MVFRDFEKQKFHSHIGTYINVLENLDFSMRYHIVLSQVSSMSFKYLFNWEIRSRTIFATPYLLCKVSPDRIHKYQNLWKAFPYALLDICLNILFLLILYSNAFIYVLFKNNSFSLTLSYQNLLHETQLLVALFFI